MITNIKILPTGEFHFDAADSIPVPVMLAGIVVAMAVYFFILSWLNQTRK